MVMIGRLGCYYRSGEFDSPISRGIRNRRGFRFYHCFWGQTSRRGGTLKGKHRRRGEVESGIVIVFVLMFAYDGKPRGL